MSPGQPPSAEPIWQLGGLICGLVWQGRYIYLAVGPRLLVVDVTDRAAPVVVGRSAPLGGSLARLAVHGDFAYACTRGLLHVFDVRDPTDPRAVGSCAAEVTRPHAPTPRAGGCLYLDGAIIDVSDPASPRLLDARLPSDVAVVRGRYAYVAHSYGLDVLDVTEPSAPVPVASLELPTVDGQRWRPGESLGEYGPVWGLDIVGDHLWYVSGRLYPDRFAHRGSAPVYAIDVSDPLHPREAGSFPGPNGYNGLAVSGDRAYRATGLFDMGGSVVILDVTDPVTPRRLGVYRTAPVAGVAADGEAVAFYTVRGDELTLLDASIPASPSRLSAVRVPGSAFAVAVADGLACVGMTDGLHVVDIAEPAAPREVGFHAVDGGVQGVQANRGHVWVYGWDEVRILDLADPTRPRVVDAFRTTGEGEIFRGLVVGDRYACALYGTDRSNVPDNLQMHVRRLTDPARPELVGDYSVGGGVEQVVIDGRHALVLDRAGFARLIDLDGPRELAVVGQVPRDEGGAAMVGERGFLWTTSEVRIMDLADPTRPVQLGTVRIDGSTIYDVGAAGDRLYLAAEDELRGLDIAVPSSPVEIDRRPHLTQAHEAGPAYLYMYGAARPEHRTRVLFNQATSGPAVIGVDGQFDDAALVGEHLCLARHEEGFWIVRVPVRA